MKVNLILGCWGRQELEFKICNGIENLILDITKNNENNIMIVQYLDSHYKLFNKPLYNNVHTVIFNIQDKFSTKDKPIFNSKFFKIMEEFCIMHRKCGLYLRLDLDGGLS